MVGDRSTHRSILHAGMSPLFSTLRIHRYKNKKSALKSVITSSASLAANWHASCLFISGVIEMARQRTEILGLLERIQVMNEFKDRLKGGLETAADRGKSAVDQAAAAGQSIKSAVGRA